MRLFAASFLTAGIACVSVSSASAARASAPALYAVGYGQPSALRAAVRAGAVIVRRVPAIRIAEVRSQSPGFAAALRRASGIRFVQRARSRRSAVEPALLTPAGVASPYEWQYS